jgi:hypothetical protein
VTAGFVRPTLEDLARQADGQALALRVEDGLDVVELDFRTFQALTTGLHGLARYAKLSGAFALKEFIAHGCLP